MCAKLEWHGLKRGRTRAASKPILPVPKRPTMPQMPISPLPGDLAQRPSPVPLVQHPLVRVNYTKTELREMLAEAVRNTI